MNESTAFTNLELGGQKTPVSPLMHWTTHPKRLSRCQCLCHHHFLFTQKFHTLISSITRLHSFLILSIGELEGTNWVSVVGGEKGSCGDWVKYWNWRHDGEGASALVAYSGQRETDPCVFALHILHWSHGNGISSYTSAYKHLSQVASLLSIAVSIALTTNSWATGSAWFVVLYSFPWKPQKNLLQVYNFILY